MNHLMRRPQTIYRNLYQPSAFNLRHVELSFFLHEHETLVEAELSFQRRTAGSLYLYGDDLTLISIALDGHLLTTQNYRRVGSDLVLDALPQQFVLTIKTRLFPQRNTHLSGLYQTKQGFCTQCEAEGFRRIMFFPDRPDVLTTYTTYIEADYMTFPVLLSNGNLSASGHLENGRHWVRWTDPFKKPSYLFALFAGDLARVQAHFTTCSGREIALHLYVEHDQTDKCTHALTALQHAMRWDEEQYGREYDLDIYMIVAVSDFNMGAMENKGLNIFNAKYILASPHTATDDDYESVESVVGHEYFHNWSGNRVTCRDWFQLSLKEGLTVFREQSFSEDQYARDMKRIETVRMLRQVQFPEDAGSMAHPVRPESYEEINNFYTATVYEKGAEIIRMLQTILGKEKFRLGMNHYFSQYDGQAVTIDDFLHAMAHTNTVDLTQFSYWYSQAGTPVVTVEKRVETGTLSLILNQTCPATPETAKKEPFHIPIQVAFFDRQGTPLTTSTTYLELKERTQTFTFPEVPTDAVISLLRHFSAPIKLDYTPSEADHLILLRAETDGFAKWEAAQHLALTLLTRWVNQPPHPMDGLLPHDLKNAYAHVLQDPHTDQALRALLLTPPSFEEVAACFQEVEVDSIENARDAYRKALAHAILEPAMQLIIQLWEQETHAMDPISFARRKLRNTCLTLLCLSNHDAAWHHCEHQFQEAHTMTDESAALALLVYHPTHRDSALERFYHRWKTEDLVLDKWFAAQGACSEPDVLVHIRTLLSHPKFHMTNPNKLRALINSFTLDNPRYFHARDGSGYEFLTEILLIVDAVNPQVAAKLATPFTRAHRYDAMRRSLMLAQLERLNHAHLSKDLSEIVSKTLQKVNESRIPS